MTRTERAPEFTRRNLVARLEPQGYETGGGKRRLRRPLPPGRRPSRRADAARGRRDHPSRPAPRPPSAPTSAPPSASRSPRTVMRSRSDPRKE
jgi:hypothetical protein